MIIPYVDNTRTFSKSSAVRFLVVPLAVAADSRGEGGLPDLDPKGGDDGGELPSSVMGSEEVS